MEANPFYFHGMPKLRKIAKSTTTHRRSYSTNEILRTRSRAA